MKDNNDTGIAAVIAKAAKNEKFFKRLKDDRAGALAEFTLPDEARDLLLAADFRQIEAMAKEARKRPWYSIPNPGCVLGAGITSAAAILAITVPSLGHSAEDTRRAHAITILRTIAQSEGEYRGKYISWGTLETLANEGWINREYVRGIGGYRYAITITGDSYEATAVHARLPGSRPSFRIGSDGVVWEIAPDGKAKKLD